MTKDNTPPIVPSAMPNTEKRQPSVKFPEHPRIDDPKDLALIWCHGKNILVRRYPPKDSPGELYVPDRAKHVPHRYWVEGVGPQAQSAGLEVGDTVILGGYSIMALEDERDAPAEPEYGPAVGFASVDDVLAIVGPHEGA